LRPLKSQFGTHSLDRQKTVFYRDGLLSDGHTKEKSKEKSFFPNKARRVVWDSYAIMLRRLTGSLKVEERSFYSFGKKKKKILALAVQKLLKFSWDT
jgi:hypothetical protein